MSLPFFKNSMSLGIAFESVRQLQKELTGVFRDVIEVANNGAFAPIQADEGKKTWLSIFNFNQRESTKLNYGTDYLVLTSQNLEVTSNFNAEIKEGKTVKISNCKCTFDLDFCGPNGFDAFFLLRNNFKLIASSFEDLSDKDSPNVSYFDVSKSNQNVSYQKSDSAQYSNIAWSGIIFNCFIFSNIVETTKDIKFFINYGR